MGVPLVSKVGLVLGLALAYQLMQAQAGSLEVSSTLGVGTTIILRFPPSEEAPEQASKLIDFLVPNQQVVPIEKPRQVLDPQRVAAASQKNSLSVKNSTRVLVVDDDALNRKVVLRYLDGEAFELFEAESGQEAIEIFHRVGGFGLILLDIMMPGMNGYEVCRELRRSASAVELPILMLTAKQELNDLLEGFESGANDYIHKPFQREELRARSRAHISFARTSRAMKCFVPENFIRLLGYGELADVGTRGGDREKNDDRLY